MRVSGVEQGETTSRRGEAWEDTGRALLDTHGHGGAPKDKKQHEQQTKKTAKTGVTEQRKSTVTNDYL